MMPLVALVVAYLVGGIPFGYLLVHWKTGEDVREKGSGNIGATNVLRTTGRAMAVVTLLLDIAKGVFAVYDGVSGEPRRQRSREGCLLGASALRAAVCSRKAVNARESATFNLLRL